MRVTGLLRRSLIKSRAGVGSSRSRRPAGAGFLFIRLFQVAYNDAIDEVVNKWHIYGQIQCHFLVSFTVVHGRKPMINKGFFPIAVLAWKAAGLKTET